MGDAVCGELCGCPGMPNLRIPFGPIIGAPPYYVVIYSLDTQKITKTGEKQRDLRHLNSKKAYYMKTALWSRVQIDDTHAVEKLMQSQGSGPRSRAAIWRKNSKGSSKQQWFMPECWSARSRIYTWDDHPIH